jgi:hypothetical protein
VTNPAAAGFVFVYPQNAAKDILRADKRHGGRADANVMALPWRAATVPAWREYFALTDSSGAIFFSAFARIIGTAN